MTFVAVILLALVAVTVVVVDAWDANRVLNRVRDELHRDPAPWWLPRD